MAQNVNFDHLDYMQIEKKIDSIYNKPNEALKLINLYISKSKKENNNEALLYAYRYASKYFKNPVNIKYADSALMVGKKSSDKRLITEAYLNKGTVLLQESKYEKALDNILKANKYSVELKNDYLTNKTIYFIAQNKIYLGQYEDANQEFQTCVSYFRSRLNSNILGEDNKTFYIYSLMSLIDSNTRLGKQKENITLLKEAHSYIKKNNLNSYLPYFISSEGTDAFYLGDYNKAISKLTQAIRLYDDQWTHITEVYYIGLANWKLGKHSVAVKYLEELDKNYNKTNKLDPQFRSTYELLIKYYDSIGNKDKQLEYINKLMDLDKSHEKNLKYLYTRINKEYDTQKLITEKNRIENSLKNQRAVISLLLLAAIIIISVFGYRYYHFQKIYKERFNEIIADKNKNKEIKEEVFIPENTDSSNTEEKIQISAKNFFDMEFYNKIPGLNPLFVENILNQLNAFENEQKYLDNQVSQKLLSENLGTNSSYLSKIINVYKGKSFNQYINDLRLDYIIDLMKSDVKYLNIDIKDLAIMAGFTNAISFSDNFQRRYQIKPSYFIKMMKENIRSSFQSHNPTSDSENV